MPKGIPMYFADDGQRAAHLSEEGKKWRAKHVHGEYIRGRNRTLGKYIDPASGCPFSQEAFEIMFKAQAFCCAACGSDTPGSKRGWHTDHNHKTGVVRGILCQSCNAAAGQAKEDVRRLRLLALYLEKHSG